MSSAVALALVAAWGVHEASAQKGKEQRKRQPVKVRIESVNLTTGETGRHISAAAGDLVRMTLRVDNRSGLAQNAVVHIVGGVPGCIIDLTVQEFFEAGQRKSGFYEQAVPEGESGILTCDVSVLMTKSGDEASWDASVTFGSPLKGESSASGNVFVRAFTRMMLRSMLTLSDDGSDIPAMVNMTEFKGLYR